MIDSFVYWFSIFVLYYYLVIYTFYALLITLSIPAVYKRQRELKAEDFTRLIRSDSLPTVALIMPLFNEDPDMVIPNIVASLNLSYPAKEVIVVNDGSTTDVLQKMVEAFDCELTTPVTSGSLKCAKIKAIYRSRVHSNFFIIDKENGGKGDSQNAGINITIAPLILLVDVDTVIEDDALLRMVRPFYSKEGVVGEGGTLRIINGCTVENGRITKKDLPRELFAGVQVVEYLRAFLYGRLGWNSLGGNLLISGAFGLFDRDAIVQAGGYDSKAIGEDLDLTLNLIRNQRKQKKFHAIEFIPDPVCWTEVPAKVKKLGRQRERWHMGLLQALIKYRSMMFNPKYGTIGMLGLPYMLIGELIEPIVEALGYVVLIAGICMGILSWKIILFFFLIPWGLSCILTTIAISMENSAFRRYQKFSQLVKMLFFSLFENLGFRQLYVYWRLRGFWRYFRGETSWK